MGKQINLCSVDEALILLVPFKTIVAVREIRNPLGHAHFGLVHSRFVKNGSDVVLTLLCGPDMVESKFMLSDVEVALIDPVTNQANWEQSFSVNSLNDFTDAVVDWDQELANLNK